LESLSIDKLIGQDLEHLSLSGAELQQAEVHLLHVEKIAFIYCMFDRNAMALQK